LLYLRGPLNLSETPLKREARARQKLLKMASNCPYKAGSKPWQGKDMNAPGRKAGDGYF